MNNAKQLRNIVNPKIAIYFKDKKTIHISTKQHKMICDTAKQEGMMIYTVLETLIDKGYTAWMQTK